MSISFETQGSFKKTEKYLRSLGAERFYDGLEIIAREGVAALAGSTPKDSGETANSWDYEIIRKRGRVEIVWTNSNVVQGVPVAIILQYGHGTGTGGYVQGYDYINPSIRPIFDAMTKKVWQGVTK